MYPQSCGLPGSSGVVSGDREGCVLDFIFFQDAWGEDVTHVAG